MIENIKEILSFDFLIITIIVGGLISLCASLLGVSLVLKRYSMIGDGLSHVGFGALAVANVLGVAPLIIATPTVVLAAFCLLRLSENGKIKGDSAIALLAATSLALGTTIVSISGTNTDLSSYMFGSILAINRSDLVLSVILTALILILFVFFYNKLFAVTFDENFSKATGVHTGFYNMVLSALTAVTIVLGMRIVGTLLISSLIIFPSLTSMRICKKFKTVTISSALLSIICFLIGIYVSYVHSTPTGASIVTINAIFFGIFALISFVNTKIKKQEKQV